jgi:hypothetical protein
LVIGTLGHVVQQVSRHGVHDRRAMPGKFEDRVDTLVVAHTVGNPEACRLAFALQRLNNGVPSKKEVPLDADRG